MKALLMACQVLYRAATAGKRNKPHGSELTRAKVNKGIPNPRDWGKGINVY